MSIPKHVLLFLLMVLSLSVNAQVFPVQGNVVLNPPYSPYLADLTALGSQRFWLTLRLQDPTINTYNCKLRLTIEGVGITIRTKNTFLPQPITLEGGGIPQFFYGDDLSAYFNPVNLDFAGLTRSQYERTQRLPEGVYRFTIEVLDYNRGTAVSNKIGTTAWIVLNDPPILNLPRNDTKINILEPTNIPFTWTPRHTGSPNAAFTTNYTFRLIELAPNATSQSANAAFLSQPVLYETSLSQNQLVYGAAEPTLLAGRKYAWQVQATDTEGRDLFRNNGKSEVFVFQYGDALGIPRNVLQQGGNATTLSMQWELPNEGEMPAQYRIRYKPLNSPANNYFESVTTNRYYTLGELNPSTTYLVQVRSERNSTFSEYSPILQMSTTSIEERPYTCGQAPVLTPPTTTEILQRLFPGDEIRMHDFRMMVLTVEGSNGYFSGTGLMPVSLFNNASVKVRFSGKVNKNYELAGEIVSTYAKGNAMGQLVEEIEKIDADRAAPQNNASDTIAMPVAITIIGIIDSVWVQDSVIIVLREDGTQEEITRPETPSGVMQEVVLTDSEGNSYTVNKDGEVINNGSSATSTVASTVRYKVNFSAKEDQDYGFDAKVHEVLNHYETATIEGDAYTIPWKSVETGRFDKVKITSTVQRENLIQEVGFSADTESLPKQQGENASELIVTLQGKAHELTEQITAYLNQQNTTDSTTNRLEVGKLNVISYNKAYKNLVLISVNGAQLPIPKEKLQTELNDIYKQAIVQWQVQPVQTLTEIDYDTDNNGLEYGNSSWFSNYTGEMRTIINTYLQDRSLMPDTYYLFIVPKTDDAQVMGFMPRKKQMGFICSEKVTVTNVTKTIAHELAHGAFRLEHSFPLLPQQGDNLMDYSANGKNLYKTQWDYIHNPVAMLGLFEGDDEGAMALPCWGWFDDCDDVVAILKGIKARVGLSLPSLPLFKPDPSRSRGSEYVGYSIELGGETYAKITIKNEIKRDTVIHAENYLDYENQDLDKIYVGFMYSTGDGSNFKILLSNEEDTVALNLKREKLRQYLFGDSPSSADFNFKLFLGNLEKLENSIFTITANPPLMPDVRASVQSTDTIHLRLKIEYIARKTWTDATTHTNELVREDVSWFPEREWMNLNSGEVWDIDFADSFRGGKAYLYCKLNNIIVDSIVFHIRGENPLEQDVHTYVNTVANGNGWYVPKMIRQESSFRQFNIGEPSAANQSAGMPNWGPPYGWGMKQLDNLGAEYGYRTELNGRVVRQGGASPDELWNWQLNVSKGIQFFNGAKLPIATARWNDATTALALWSRTHPNVAVNMNNMLISSSPVTAEVGLTVTQIRAGDDTNFEIIVPTPTGNQRSLIDAHACKFYNGGNNYFTIIIPASNNRGAPALPYWSINKVGNGRDYVNDISGRAGW